MTLVEASTLINMKIIYSSLLFSLKKDKFKVISNNAFNLGFRNF